MTEKNLETKKNLEWISHNNENDICNKCGKHITTQTLIGALCEECTQLFYSWCEEKYGTIDVPHQEAFIKFVLEREHFVFT